MAYDGGSVVIRVSVETGAAKAEIEGLKQQTKGITWQGIKDGDQAAQNLAKTLSSTGKALTLGVTVPLAAVGAASIKAASDMETAFAQVKKTVDATDEQYQALYDDAVHMSTVHPVSAADVATIESLGAQLGISTDNLSSFAEVCYGLNIATDLDAETAATDLAQFANITGTSQAELSNVGSTLVELGNTSATTESNIMGLGMRIAASGTQAGMSAADILGISAALSSLGMDAEAGGTAMSLTLNQIGSDVATNSENLQTWASLAGESVDQFVQDWNTGGDVTTETFAKVVTGMATTSDEGGNLTVLLDQLGITGIRQSDAMKRLASNTDLLTTSIKNANQGYSENTALGNEVSNFEDTLSSKWEMLKNKVTAAAIEFGGPLIDSLSALVDQLGPTFDSLSQMAQAFADMSDEERKSVILAAGMIAAIGPMVSLMGKGVGAAKGISTAIQLFGSAAAKAAGDTGEATTAIKLMTAAQVAAKAATAAVATAITVVLAVAIQQYVDRQKAAKQAQDDYRNSCDNLDSAIANTSSSLDGATAKYGDLSEKVDTTRVTMQDLADAQQKAADTINDTNDTASTQIGMLQASGDTIAELANKSGLTTDEQGRLRNAIDQVNQQCGTQYTLTDAVNGVITDETGAVVTDTGAIWDMVAAKQESIRMDALQADYQAAYEAHSEAIKAQVDAYSELQDTEARVADARQNIQAQFDSGNMKLPQYNEEMQNCDRTLEEARQAYSDAGEAVDSTQASMDSLNEQMGIAQTVASGSASAVQKYADSHQTLTYALSQNGQDINTFIDQLNKAGISTTDLSNLTDDQLIQMAASYDGTAGSIVDSLSGLGIDLETIGGQSISDWYAGMDGESQNAIDEAASISGLTLGSFVAAAEQMGYTGTDGMLAFAQGIQDGTIDVQTATDAANAAATVADQSGDSYGKGSGSSSSLASGLGANIDSVYAQAQAIATAQQEMDQSGAAGTWGYDAGANLADGMYSAGGQVEGAADYLAAIVNARLHQSTADIGPLRYTDQWGGDLVDNITGGMERKESSLKTHSERLANIMAGINWYSTSGTYNRASSFGGGISVMGSTDNSSVKNYGNTSVNITVNAPSGDGKAIADALDERIGKMLVIGRS